jgi:hypothetical protein
MTEILTEHVDFQRETVKINVLPATGTTAFDTSWSPV